MPAGSRRGIALPFAVTAVLVLAACTGSEDVETTTTPADPTGPVLQTSLSAEETVVTVTLTNTGDEPGRVVRPTVTPNFVLFVVTDASGEALQYLGTYPELRPLDESGFVTLAPGETTAAAFDLAQLFPISSGTFQVEAEYRNPAGGSHQGTSALTFEPGEGVSAAAIAIEVP